MHSRACDLLSTPKATATREVRALVVDSVPLARARVARLLLTLGVNVIGESERIEDARTAARNGSVDLVVADALSLRSAVGLALKGLGVRTAAHRGMATSRDELAAALGRAPSR